MSTLLSNTAPVISSGETGVSGTGVSVDTDHAVESWSSASLGGVISYTAGLGACENGGHQLRCQYQRM